MAEFRSKYDLGEVVWYGSTVTAVKRMPCPDCLGAGRWQVRSPAGVGYDFPCPRCNVAYRSNDDLRLDYPIHAPRVVRLTIGSVRMNSDGGFEYMCLETGVGSGTIYREDRLHRTEEDAMTVATTDADLQNTDPGGQYRKLYDRRLELSDYQLAEIQSRERVERDERHRAARRFASELADEIEDDG